MQDYTLVQIKRPERWQADSVTACHSPKQLFELPQTLEEYGIDISNIKLDEDTKPPKDTDKLSVDFKRAAEYATQKTFETAGIKSTGYIVGFVCGSIAYVKDSDVAQPDEHPFTSFLEEHAMPVHRFKTKEDLIGLCTENEKWWRSFKAYNPDKVVIANVAFRCLLDLYPRPGIPESDADVLYLFEHKTSTADKRKQIAVCKPRGTIVMNVAEYEYNGSGFSNDTKLLYTLANNSRDYIRSDYMVPRITEIWRYDIK